MQSIPQLYSASVKQSNYGIEGYHVDNKYFQGKSTTEVSKVKVHSTTQHKKTYIDMVQKIAATLPGPSTYHPQLARSRSSQCKNVDVKIERKTIFDEMDAMQKKFNYPRAGNYDHIITEVDKKKLKANLSKAENANYLENSMRNAIEKPGVGNYNPQITVFDKKGNKWGCAAIGNSKSKEKLPPVGTYDPTPSYQLSKKKGLSLFGKADRFSKNKDKKMPFYDVVGEWGMNGKLKKKNILERISSGTNHRSVYY